MARNPLTETDWAYLAGLFDGEGCFRINQSNGLNSYPWVELSNTYKPVVEFVQEAIVGNLYREQKSSRVSKKPIYRVRALGPKAIALCSALLPYLREKRAQAACLLELDRRRQEIGKWPLWTDCADLVQQLSHAKRAAY